MNNINQATIDLIKRNEGCILHPYQDMVGVWTIGYGHIEGVTAETPLLTQAQADQQLIDDLTNIYAPKVAERIGNSLTTDNQFGAMLSLAYNVGVGGFAGSTVAREHCAGNHQAAADAFLMWDQAGGHVVRALLRRRGEERALYLTADGMTQPAEPAGPASGSVEAAVRALQAALGGLRIDGNPGPLTIAALRRWQASR